MDVADQSGLLLKGKPAKRTRLQQEARIGLLFLSPWLIGFILLKALPILAALIFSLTDFHMLTPEETRFVGLENYVRFVRDTQAGASLFGSLGYFLLIVPLEMIVALVLAAIFTSQRLKNPSDGVACSVVRVRYVGRVETPLFV
jgi:ABC-type sugar transport system permease subunit